MNAPRYLAQITLPETDNEGNSLVTIHDHLKNSLLLLFNGYTSVAATGGWQDNINTFVEDVIVYSVAMTREAYDIRAFEILAADIAAWAHQEVVAILLPTGEFKLIEPRTPAATNVDPHWGGLTLADM